MMALEPQAHRDLVSKVIEASRTVPEGQLLLEASLENYTPIMLGDYDSYTWRSLDARAPGAEPSRPLVAQGIIGRMRWLLRLLIASLNCGDSASNYSELEDRCPVEVKLDDGEVKVGLAKALMGFVGSSQLGKSMSSPFALQADLDVSGAGIWSRASWVTRAAGPNEGGEGGQPDRFNALLSRGWSRRADRLLTAPMEPGSVKVRLRALALPRAGLTLGDASQRLGALYAALAVIVPTVFGVGKGVNRGFGRFVLTEAPRINSGIEGLLSDVVSDLEALGYVRGRAHRGLTAEEAEVKLRSLFRHIIELAAKAVGAKAADPNGRTIDLAKQDSLRLALVPSAGDFIGLRVLAPCGQASNNTFSRPSIVLSAVVVPVRGNSVDDAIEAIGSVTAKPSWKASPGGCSAQPAWHHTWPLGLPRGRGAGAGYLVTRGGNSMRPPRRQSMVMLFPLPATTPRQEVLVAVMPIVGGDVLDRWIAQGLLRLYNERGNLNIKDLLQQRAVEAACAVRDSVLKLCPEDFCSGCPASGDDLLACEYYRAICVAYYSVAELLRGWRAGGAGMKGEGGGP